MWLWLFIQQVHQCPELSLQHKARGGGRISSPRFLTLRMSVIGDTVLTLPVVCALRAQFPDAFIGWVVEEKSSAMVVGHPCVDQAFTLPRRWFLSLKKCRELRKELQSQRFTVSIDCQKHQSSLACWLSGAKYRVGCRGKYGTELSTYLNNILVLRAAASY